MVAWSEYKQTAKERGALALELYVVESTPAMAPEDVKNNLGDHLAYQAEMERQGILALAGPLSDPTGEVMAGGGMIVYRAESLKDANELASNDPMHKSGARTFTIRKWLVNEGSLSLNVGLSTGKITLS